MIDLHCHALWGIDDGPKSLEESIKSCKALKVKGITKIVATPHYIPDSIYMASPQIIAQKVNELKTLLASEEPGLDILSGMELYITPELPELLKSKEVLTLNETKYCLVETSLNNIPDFVEEVFFKLQLEGYIPVFAHPERYSGNMDIKKIEGFISKGALMQVNMGSIIGKYGKKAKSFADKLLSAGLVHFMATDSHGHSERFTNVEEIKKHLNGFIGTENTEKLLYINPERLINNGDIECIKPRVKRSFFRMFTSKLK